MQIASEPPGSVTRVRVRRPISCFFGGGLKTFNRLRHRDKRTTVRLARLVGLCYLLPVASENTLYVLFKKTIKFQSVNRQLRRLNFNPEIRNTQKRDGKAVCNCVHNAPTLATHPPVPSAAQRRPLPPQRGLMACTVMSAVSTFIPSVHPSTTLSLSLSLPYFGQLRPRFQAAFVAATRLQAGDPRLLADRTATPLSAEPSNSTSVFPCHIERQFFPFLHITPLSSRWGCVWICQCLLQASFHPASHCTVAYRRLEKR